jgi:hypothetical protein
MACKCHGEAGEVPEMSYAPELSPEVLSGESWESQFAENFGELLPESEVYPELEESGFLTPEVYQQEVLPEVLGEHGGSAGSPPVRFFHCSTADLARIQTVLGVSVSVATLRAALASRATRAVAWCWSASGALRVSPRTAATQALFREAFATAPGTVPTWKPANATWVDIGDLVALRLNNAAKILNGGWIHYFCLGSATHCPECTSPPSSYIACSSFKGRYLICLGEHFWRAWQSRAFATMSANLIHEALHIYFGRTVGHQGRTGNASCYQRFVLRANGIALPSHLVTRCPTP